MNIDTRKLKPEAQEALRVRGMVLVEKGKALAEVSKLLEVARQTVYRWKKLYDKGGMEALATKKQGRPKGTGKKLKNHQCAMTVRIITDNCPDQLKMPFVLWTRQAVKELIRKEFGVEMPLSTVGVYLRRWGFTPQKPIKKAYQQQSNAVKKWLDEEYPEIKLIASEEKGEIHWGDETGFRSDCQVGRGYAPQGKTPELKKTGSRFGTNMISTITNQGKVRFMIYDGKMNADLFVGFLERLIKSSDKKIFMIVDNLKVHHAYIVRDWINERTEKIKLFFLPSYSPELNPDEYLNCDLKGNANAKRMPRDKVELKDNLLSHMTLLQKNPERVKSYFQHEKIKYAAA